jgi:hypothetical protein
MADQEALARAQQEEEQKQSARYRIASPQCPCIQPSASSHALPAPLILTLLSSLLRFTLRQMEERKQLMLQSLLTPEAKERRQQPDAACSRGVLLTPPPPLSDRLLPVLCVCQCLASPW